MKVILEKTKNDVIPYKEYFPGFAVIFELSSPFIPEKPNSKYWLRCHKCSLTANLGDHEITIDNKIITISPSILCPNDKCEAHYYITNSEIV